MGNNNIVVYYASIGMCLLALAGCAVGPDFRRPAPPSVSGYTPTPLATNLNSSPTMLGDPQNIIKGERLTKHWWRAMSTDTLDMLISEALERNPTLLAAALASGRNLCGEGWLRYPQLDGTWWHVNASILEH